MGSLHQSAVVAGVAPPCAGQSSVGPPDNPIAAGCRAGCQAWSGMVLDARHGDGCQA